MNTKKTRLLSILFAFVMSMTGVSAFAHDIAVANSGVTIYYTWQNNKTELAVSYRGSSYTSYSNEYTGKVVIPEKVTYNGNKYPVTSIDNYAFFGCSGLTSVNIPYYVTSIGDYAFYCCSGLTSININNATSIGKAAFRECSNLASVQISTKTMTIGDYAFCECSGLTSVTIPNSVTSIGDRAFYYCDGLTSVTIPNSVTSIGKAAFMYCTELTSVHISNSVTNIEENTFRECSSLTSVNIPNSVTSIGDAAFYGCTKLSNLYLYNSSSLTSIGDDAFEGCSSLQSVDIPKSVTTIGDRAFNDCGKLTSVTVKMQSPPTISYNTFSNRTNATLYVPAGCKAAYEAANYWKEFKQIVVPINFDDDRLKLLCLDNWDSNHDGELSEDEAAVVTDLGSVFSYEENITSFNELQYFTGLTSIGNSAFEKCYELRSITIPNSVTSIGNSAFRDCYELRFITIPNSVTSIGNRAFEECYELRSITIPNSVTSTGSNAFYGTGWYDNQSDGVLYLDNWLLGYKGDNPTGDLIIPDGTTGIAKNAFSYCSGLTSVAIPNSVTSIGDLAFHNCSGLTSIIVENENSSYISEDGVLFDKDKNTLLCFPAGKTQPTYTIPETVTNIYSYAFAGCNITSVTIPNSVTSIGNYAFNGCTSLTSVTVEMETPLTIAEYTFSNRANATLYVPAGCKAAYETANYWKEFKAIVEMAPPSPAITFANANVKAICVQNWDTNGDGELSEAEAAAVTDLGTTFQYKRTITSFDELQYFTGLTSIGYQAFRDCSGLTSVTIPNSVTSIGETAFYGCSGLTSVTIPNTVTSIGINAFSDCGLTSVTIPRSVTFIDEFAFTFLSNLTSIIVEGGNINYDSRDNCNAIIETNSNTLIAGCKNTIIPNSVTSIGEYAFSGCSGLTSVTIPNSVTSIGTAAFSDCSLTSVTIPSSVTSIGGSAFRYCNRLTSVTIPNSVNTIGQMAFSGCSYLQRVKISDLAAWCNIAFEDEDANPLTYAHHLYDEYGEITYLDIPDNVTSIGEYAFSGCIGLTGLTIPNSVTRIGGNAFNGCTNLTSVTIPNSVTNIGEGAFYNCSSLTSVTVEMETPLTIAEYTFSNRTNATLYVPAGCKAAYEAADYWKEFKEIIEMEAPSPAITFANANVKALCVQNWDTNGDGELSEAEAAAVTDLGEVFKENTTIISFDELQYFTGLTKIGISAFYHCSSLTSVTIPNSVTTIESFAFEGCKKMTSVTIPNSVASIGNGTFQSCNGLTSVTIPGSVTSIGYAAFSQCISLTSIIVEDGNNSYISEDGVLFNYNKTSLLCYPAGKTESTYTIPNSVTSIGRSAFNGCSKLTSVTIPSSVTDIGIYAFNGCSKLTSVTIPNSVTSIGNYAFNECSKLTSVDIPNSVTTLGYYAFYKCYDLTSVTIGNSVKSIGMSTFRYCNSLKSITIPNSVTRIDMEAFRGCTSLSSVTIPESVTSLGTQAFRDCSALTSVKVGMESPLTIDSETFTNRANTTLYIPKGCKSAYQAADYWKEFKAIKEFPDSDVNQDGEIDMMDVVDIARFVVGTPAETFVEFLADLNNNGEVNVADAVVLVNEIVGDQNFAKAFGAPQTAPMGDDRLTLTKNDDHSLSFSMESQRDYTAFQFDLYTNSEDDVMGLRLNTARKHGHQLIYNKVDEGHYRVVALSVANHTFNGNNGELLNIQLDGFNATDMTISNIHFITTDGTDYRFDDLSLSNATGIEGLYPDSAEKSDENIYDLSGRKVSDSSVLPRGVYIKNGSKVVIK